MLLLLAASPGLPRKQQHTALLPGNATDRRPAMVVYTAVLGSYERTLKEPAACSDVPFIAYTDREDLKASDWPDGNEVPDGKSCWTVIPDARTIAAKLDKTSGLVNSIDTHASDFNVAKFFKCNPHALPELADFQYVVWIDSTVHVYDTLPVLLLKLQREEMMALTFEHDDPTRAGLLEEEKKASLYDKYVGNEFQNEQPIESEYRRYLDEGFREKWWANSTDLGQLGACPQGERCGMWLTCLLAWNMKHPKTLGFLADWSAAWSGGITQDQVTFPYVAWKQQVLPYTLPDEEIVGDGNNNSLYLKLEHGRNREVNVMGEALAAL